MSRATPQDVRDINGSTLTDPEIQPFLDTAHILVNSVQLCANTDEETLKEAEAWLAAHLMSVSSIGQGAGGGAKAQESFDLYSITWATAQATGDGVNGSNYGQTANMLLGGCLYEKSKQKAAISFFGGA